MNYRNATVLASESLNASGTKVIDLTLQDVISRICIQVKATNNGTTLTAHPAEIVSQIEIVDGSDVLCSMSAKEALALSYYQTGRTPFVVNNYQDDEMAIFNAEIMFGRFLYDELLALNPTKFRNLQLKITYDRDAGGSAPDAATLRVKADVFDQKTPAPVGFLTTKEVVSYVMTASANEYIDLPIDNIMRGLMIQSEKAGTAPSGLYNNIKLSEDNDKRVPINEATSDLLKYFAALLPALQENFTVAGNAAAQTIYCMTGYEGWVNAVQRDGAAGDFIATQPAGGTFDLTGGAGGTVQGGVVGYAPFGSLYLPFGKQNVIEDWFDVTKIGSLRLTLKGASGLAGTETCQVTTVQLRKYQTLPA